MKFINSFFSLGEGFFSLGEVETLKGSKLIAYNKKLAEELGISLTSREVVDYFSGKKKFKGSKIYSTVYSGHQFGVYVGRLGDGRVHFLGEIESPKGNPFEIQLKGSGKTEYSRFGDGKAVLRSSIREYLVSEAMHNLGIPTTRSLCLIGSDEDVEREFLEKGAMLTRVAPTFLRFGHIEHFSHNNQYNNLKTLCNFLISKFYKSIENDEKKYEKLFYQIVAKTALLIAKWQAFGFVHGVMNTDNMSLIGITMDYGPYGFMDGYDSNYISNGSDYEGRYSYNNQPIIGMWNLQALAYAFTPLIDIERSMEIVSMFKNIFEKEYFGLMRGKLGLEKEDKKDKNLIHNLLNLLEENNVDYTIFFRNLSNHNVGYLSDVVKNLFSNKIAIKDWFNDYDKRIKKENWDKLNNKADNFYKHRKAKMDKLNPKYILRNYMLENAITMANKGDYSEIKKLSKIIENPFSEQKEFDNYSFAPPDWSKEIVITCSS